MRSAKPPPDVFWRVRSCILFQLDFALQVEKSRFRDNAGREAVFEASRTRTAERLGLQNEMLTWKTSQLGFPLERFITEIWQDRHRRVQNSHALRMGGDWPLKPTIRTVKARQEASAGGAHFPIRAY